MAAVERDLNDIDPAQIRAVAFDCYGTLINFDERAFAPAMHTLLQQHNINHVEGTVVWERWMDSSREYARVNGRAADHPIEGPEPPFLAFADLWIHHFEAALKEYDIHTISPQTAVDYIFRLLSEAPPYSEAKDVITALREAGMRVVVASNADDVHLFPVLERARIEPEFILSSEQVQSYKPRKPFFDAVCDRLDIPSEQILFVGDSPNADVIGARNAGMPIYWVRRYDDAHRERNLKERPAWVYPNLRGLLDLLLGQPA